MRPAHRLPAAGMSTRAKRLIREHIYGFISGDGRKAYPNQTAHSLEGLARAIAHPGATVPEQPAVSAHPSDRFSGARHRSPSGSRIPQAHRHVLDPIQALQRKQARQNQSSGVSTADRSVDR